MKLSAGIHSERDGVGAQSNGSFNADADASMANDDAAAGNAESVASAFQITGHLESVKGDQRRRKIITHDGDSELTDNDLNSSLSPKNAPSTIKQQQRLSALNRKRDLINLQSALSPKYIGYANANSPTPLSDSDDTVRTTRRRVNQAAALNNNNSNSNSCDVPPRDNDEGTESPKTVEGTPLLDRSESKTYMSPIEKLLLKNGASSPNSTGFETDPEDVAPLASRLKLKRKLKRAAKTSPPAERTEKVAITEREERKEEANPEMEEQKVEATSVVENQTEEAVSIVKEELKVEATLKREEPPVETSSEIEDQMGTNDSQRKELTDDAVIEETVPLNADVKSESESESGTSSCDVDEPDVVESPSTSLGNEHAQEPLGDPADTSSKTIESTDEPIDPKSELLFALPAAASTNIKSPPDLSPTAVHQPENNEYVKSPSSVSLDSAKGLSIVTDPGWPTYQVGDLYWGKVFTYCFWPCMVCPDPYGQIVGNLPAHPQRTSTDNAPVPIQVHVRFFADNGRRNWIKPENLLTFSGLKAYEDIREEVRIKHGNRSGKYRTMVPKRTKLEVWRQAIDEAQLVAEVPYSERMEKFYKIYESVATLNKQKRKRTNSMTQDTSDVGSSLYDSTDNLHGKPHHQLLSVKRERSETPTSPAFSPIKKSQMRTKRRKLSKGAEAETGDGTPPKQVVVSAGKNVSPSSSGSAIYENEEFRQLFDVVKEYVMVHRHDEKVEKVLRAVVGNIWSLKQLQLRELERELACAEIDQNHELGSAVVERERGTGTTQRLSNRLKSLVERRSRTPVVTPRGTPTPFTINGAAMEPETRLSEISKPKKPVNRPIDEVVDDIFQLDSKYLFRGLRRGTVCKYCFKPGSNMVQCSRTCHSWMHADCLESKNNGLPISKKNGTKLKALEGAFPTTSPSPSPIPKAEHITGDAPDALAIIATPTPTPTIEVICHECNINDEPTCCICRQVLPPSYPSPSPGSPLKDSSETREPQPVDGTMIMCGKNMCGRQYHAGCCKYWPQAVVSSSLMRCPLHVCHTCVSDNPQKFLPVGSSKLTRCVKCPASYHQDSRCIPAGTRMLTTTTLICPRHNVAKTDAHLNVLWCFMCVKGGELLCCETCPIAVHSGCREAPIEKHENYICEECESGRLPLYGEIVWAKFNNFRWWPAIILPPTEIPNNILKKAHGESEFVVRFFGTHDHGWIPRRRVYLYIEGDNGEKLKPRSQLHRKFYNGIEEATRFLRITKARRHEQMVARGNKFNPPPYVKIRINKAVPPVRFVTNSEEHSTCDCRPEDEHPCGSNSSCLNRMLFNECHPEYCLCGDRCENRMFETRKSPRMDVVYTNERGFGLVCREPIAEGDFIIEYVGEVLNQEEFQRRMLAKQKERHENFYFLGVEKDFIIDAGPKGNMARFMNHSCDPNCTTQKWTVNCNHRVGLFAIKDIPAETELTFNYLWDDLLNDKKKACHCGSERCTGTIGGKPKDKTTNLKLKQQQRSRGAAIRIHVPPAKRAKKSLPKVKHVSADDEPQEAKKD